MAKLKTPRGKLVRKFGENIFGNAKYDRKDKYSFKKRYQQRI